jgi:hypothetical protein
MISTKVLKKHQWTSAGWINSEVGEEKTRENKDGLRSEKLPEVVKTAYGPNGELQVVNL